MAKTYSPVFDIVKCGDELGFRRGRKYIRGLFKHQEKSFFTVELQTDLIGKNDEWFIGELKTFSKGEVKKVTILKNKKEENTIRG